MQLGGLLEDLTVARARAGIERLVKLTPRTARVLREGKETILPAEQVQVGDRLRVLPGETIPVDGTILSGQTSINQAVMTGESLPVDKGPGDEVSSGTVNQSALRDAGDEGGGGQFYPADDPAGPVRRCRQGQDRGLADRWGHLDRSGGPDRRRPHGPPHPGPIRAVTILVVFCPCALVLATPTAIMAAIGNATKHGFLVREGDALERLSKVSHITFDKTGTLTFGRPQVVQVKSLDAASPPLSSTPGPRGRRPAQSTLWARPLSGAIRKRGTHSSPSRRTSKCFQAAGCGPSAGHPCAGGQPGASAGGGGCPFPPGGTGCRGVPLPRLHGGVLGGGRKAGRLPRLADTLRPDAAQTIAQVKAAGVTPVLLTGDHQEAAQAIARQLGIGQVKWSCLPQDKLDIIDGYQAGGRAWSCMIGDGINDAPALKRLRWASPWGHWQRLLPWTPRISPWSTTTSAKFPTCCGWQSG